MWSLGQPQPAAHLGKGLWGSAHVCHVEPVLLLWLMWLEDAWWSQESVAFVLCLQGAQSYPRLEPTAKVHPGLGWAGPVRATRCFSCCSGLHPCPGRGLAEKEASALVLSLFLQPLGHEAQAEAFGEGPPQQALGGPCLSLLKSVMFLSRQFLDQHGGFQHRHQRHHV